MLRLSIHLRTRKKPKTKMMMKIMGSEKIFVKNNFKLIRFTINLIQKYLRGFGVLGFWGFGD